MGFYDLERAERAELTQQIHAALAGDFLSGSDVIVTRYFSDDDTYIRKVAYIATGRIYDAQPEGRPTLLRMLAELFGHANPKVRQTVVNAAGEIGIQDFEVVAWFFDQGLFDAHHSVRNAVIGSVKKMGAQNPIPVLAWSRGYLHHADKEVRREICHGIELRGRLYPEDVLPLLEELQFDPTRRVRDTLVHVIGQIAYKKGCLETVLHALLHWENRKLVRNAVAEIVDVHDRYRNFAHYRTDEAREVIRQFGMAG